jgi:hypothetical protein
MRNAGDVDGLAGVIDGVNDSVISDADAPVVLLAVKLLAAGRPGRFGKTADLG